MAEELLTTEEIVKKSNGIYDIERDGNLSPTPRVITPKGMDITKGNSAYQFIDTDFKIGATGASDEILRNTFKSNTDSDINGRFYRKPYLNAYYFIYHPEGDLQSKNFNLAYEELKGKRYNAKIYFDKEWLEKQGFDIHDTALNMFDHVKEYNPPNSNDPEQVKRHYEELLKNLDTYDGVYANPSLINHYYELTDKLEGYFVPAKESEDKPTGSGYEITSGGWYWHQSHKRLEFPGVKYKESVPFTSKVYFHNVYELDGYSTHDAEMYHRYEQLLSVSVNDSYETKDKGIESYSGEKYSFNSGLYDQKYATSVWMAAMGKKLYITNGELTEYNEVTETYDTFIGPGVYFRILTDGTVPRLSLIYNTIPIQMKCNKVSTTDYIYTWPEYLLKNIEAINGIDYIAVDDYASGTFYRGDVDNFYRDGFTTSESKFQNMHTINYLNSLIRYALIAGEAAEPVPVAGTEEEETPVEEPVEELD